MQAEAIYTEVLQAQPRNHDALHLLGVIALQKNDLQRAVDLIGKAIDIYPRNVDFHFNYGSALTKLNQLEDAVQSYEKAIAIQPGCAEAYYNRGNALKKLKRLNAAVQSYDQAIALKPNFAEAYYVRGLALKILNRLDSAVHDFDKAIAIKPDYAPAHAERGNALLNLKQLDAAVQSYDKALRYVPDHPEITVKKSLTLLLGENFDMGWKLYEWRWKCESFPSKRQDFSQPLWLGNETLEGKTILLHGEQGLGDTIQFCRYAKLVSKLGAQVILEAPKPLVDLFADLEGASQVIEKGAALPPFDFHTPLLSLPLAFKTDIHSIPSEPKYLTASASKIAFWRERLGSQSKPLVGLVWSGSTAHKEDSSRSILLSDLAQQLPADFQYVSLQKEVRDNDKETLQLHPEILHFGDEITDFTDTAALCELMNVVISVDTSVAHLSGALGKQTWVLLPYIPDWRWLLDRDDSPWYPNMKLYRQNSIGDWAAVFARVFADLKTVF